MSNIEANHERVEEIKNEVWEMTRSTNSRLMAKAFYAYSALEELAEELHKEIQKGEKPDV